MMVSKYHMSTDVHEGLMSHLQIMLSSMIPCAGCIVADKRCIALAVVTDQLHTMTL